MWVIETGIPSCQCILQLILQLWLNDYKGSNCVQEWMIIGTMAILKSSRLKKQSILFLRAEIYSVNLDIPFILLLIKLRLFYRTKNTWIFLKCIQDPKINFSIKRSILLIKHWNTLIFT